MSSDGPVDTRFFAPRTPVEIVDFGASAEAVTLRALLESLGAVTQLHRPGTPEDFLLILEQGERAAPYLSLSGHGDETGFVFGKYGEGIDTSALSGMSMAPSTVASRVQLPDRVVLSTACLSGRAHMGEAFLRGQVRAYIAPDDYLHGADVPLFIMHFFHHLFLRQATIEEAWKHAAGYDDESRMVVMFTPNGVSRYRASARDRLLKADTDR